MLFQIEDENGVMREITLEPGMAHHVPVGRKHRMIAVEDCDVFEVSTNHLDDVVRLEDAYGRADHARV
jgi:mannose-1-phosphate guanylyltransferase